MIADMYQFDQFDTYLPGHISGIILMHDCCHYHHSFDILLRASDPGRPDAGADVRSSSDVGGVVLPIKRPRSLHEALWTVELLLGHIMRECI